MTHAFTTRSLASTIAVPLLAGLLALLPQSAQAQCATGWNANGEWTIFQKGQANPITLILEQKGRVIQGKAIHKIPNNFGEITNNGMVDGSIDGDTISFQVFWPPNGSVIGVYNAKILPSGRMDGDAYDKSIPKHRQTWFSGGALRCPSPKTPPPPPKVLKSSGKPKAKPAPDQSSKVEPAPMKVPGIMASQVFFQVPTVPIGFVILSWDAGPDHPYAEVWVKTNNGEEQFVMEAGKGSRQMQVTRGSSYTYILTDAGKTLATVNVVGN